RAAAGAASSRSPYSCGRLASDTGATSAIPRPCASAAEVAPTSTYALSTVNTGSDVLGPTRPRVRCVDFTATTPGTAPLAPKADRTTDATSAALAVRPSARPSARPPVRRGVEIDSKVVPRDECRTFRGEPDGPLRHPQPCQLHDHLRQQPVLHLEHARGERVR